MNHRAAVPMLKAAQTAWRSESRIETYLALAFLLAGMVLLGREVWRLKRIWSA